MKLERNFYKRDTLLVAKELLGKILVHEVNGIRLSGKIVETEAYMGKTDKAAHSYGGKKTPKIEPMYGEGGFSYVYFVYGSCYCFNAVTREAGTPEAVLIRAAEPVSGLEEMSQNRFKKPYEKLTHKEIKNLTNGPGKLCSAFLINKDLNKKDLCSDRFYIESSKEKENFEIVSAKRIGIDYAEEAKDFLWRFYIKDNDFVSKK